jgi:hypothetical protein
MKFYRILQIDMYNKTSVNKYLLCCFFYVERCTPFTFTCYYLVDIDAHQVDLEETETV